MNSLKRNPNEYEHSFFDFCIFIYINYIFSMCQNISLIIGNASFPIECSWLSSTFQIYSGRMDFSLLSFLLFLHLTGHAHATQTSLSLVTCQLWHSNAKVWDFTNSSSSNIWTWETFILAAFLHLIRGFQAPVDSRSIHNDINPYMEIWFFWYMNNAYLETYKTTNCW